MPVGTPAGPVNVIGNALTFDAVVVNEKAALLAALLPVPDTMIVCAPAAGVVNTNEYVPAPALMVGDPAVIEAPLSI